MPWTAAMAPRPATSRRQGEYEKPDSAVVSPGSTDSVKLFANVSSPTRSGSGAASALPSSSTYITQDWLTCSPRP